MGKIVEVKVRLRFTEKVETDEELQEIVDNVAKALTNQVENDGLAPENSEGLTRYFEVVEKFSGASNKKTFIE
jgi:hypothetical protein